MNIEEGKWVWKNSSGQLHRENAPAIKNTDGSVEWWVCGKFHRTDGPANTRADGARVWGILHNKVDKSTVVSFVVKKSLSIILLSRAIDPFCKVTVAKYAL
jgi:hypothetical protein